MGPSDRGADPLRGELLRLSGRDPFANDVAQAGQAIAAEERLVEVADHIGDVDVAGVVDPDDWSLRAAGTDAHEVHDKLLNGWG